jgi:acetyltransferase-like isoleucine patch superfamily enzyme
MIEYLRRQFDYNVACLRRKAIYLRKQGARIGSGCDLITAVSNFGSEPYLIRLGNKVTVTAGVRFITHDGSTRVFRAKFPEMSVWGNVFGPIIIDDGCFIGINAILLPGTTIGAHSIVGAGAVVKGTFPDSSVIAGVPAKRLFSVDEYVEKVRAMMIPLQARTRRELKQELISHFFGGAKPAG